MKRVLTTILLILLLIGIKPFKIDYIDITKRMIISSIGFSVNDENIIEMYLYYYQKSNSEFKKKYQILEAKTVNEVFTKASKISSIQLDYSHIEVLLLEEVFFKECYIKDLIRLFSGNPYIYPTFNIVVVKDMLDKVYDIDNIIDTINTKTLNINKRSDSFCKLASSIYDNYFMLLPYISYNNQTKSPSITQEGLIYLKNSKQNIVTFKDNPLLLLLTENTDQTITYKDEEFILMRCSKTVLRINKIFVFFYLKSNFKGSLINELKEYITTSYNKGIDYFNIDYYHKSINDIIYLTVEKQVD